jgi:glycosyltransferase involved in cell wall biosynthesis
MSIVIAAHNEESTIGRLLGAVLRGAAPGEFAIYVVCNGCTDTTAAVAGGFGSDVQVVELPEPSKRAALKAGDAVARAFPRLYVDADVELTTSDVRALRAALNRDGVMAASPVRNLRMDGVPVLVRGYYAVWQQLPHVRAGLFGRGAIAVSKRGHRKIADLSQVMSDDLAFSEAFAAGERMVVPSATVSVWPPRTLGDLVRRRVRVNTGNAEVDLIDGRSPESQTSWTDLVAVARAHPPLLICVPIFLGVAVAARIGARRRVRAGDFNTWLRDESSRRPGPDSPA